MNYPVLLAEFLVKSAVVTGLGFAVIAIFNRLAPNAKHLLWMKLFAAGLAIPLLLLLPRWEVVSSLEQSSSQEVASPAIANAPLVVAGSVSTAGAEVSNAVPEFAMSWPWILLAIWLCGVGFLWVRSMVAGYFLRRLERQARTPDSRLLKVFVTLQEQISRPVTLLISAEIKSPFTWGIMQPKIVLPVEAVQWDSADLEMILLHEMEHVRRRDALAVLISQLFLALNWVNPFAWLAVRQTTQFREEACDLRVVEAGYPSESYAEMLYRQAKTASSHFLQTCATAVAETGTIEKRIQMILKRKKPSPSAGPSLSRLLPLLLVSAILALGIAGSKEPDENTKLSVPTEPKSASIVAVEANKKKLKTIIFPMIEFTDTPLKNALEFIQKRSAELDVATEDPEKKGVNFVIQGDDDAEGAEINLRLTNVPLSEVIRYTTELAQMKYRVEANAIVLLPLTPVQVKLFTRAYQVPRMADVISNENTAKKLLKDQGIVFPAGAAAIFNPEDSNLVVRNTEEQHELVEAYVEKLHGAPAPTKTKPTEKISPEAAAIEAKLKSILLPDVQFKDTPILDALEFLQKRSVELDVTEQDARKKGINVIIQGLSEQQRGSQITLKLSNVPLGEALRYTCNLAQLNYAIDTHAVVVAPIEP